MSVTDRHIYAVNEIFYSLQGEGFFTGTPMVFVRFARCNRRCSFCDTDFAASVPMTAEAIVDEAERLAPGCRRLVLTGGEPLLQVDAELIKTLKTSGYTLHLETNGTLPVPAGIDWATCSPKDANPEPQRIDELKVVFTDSVDPEHYFRLYGEPANAFLQPCSGANIPQTIDYILRHPHWRLSLQTHKLTGIR